MPTYRSVLRSGELRAVLAAHVCAMLAMIVGDVALTVLVYQRTASPLLAALTFAIGFVPMGLGAVLLGGVGRARPSRDVLVACEVAAAALVGLMAWPGMPVPAILGLLAVKGAIDPIFSGTRAATLPELVGDEGFPLARSLLRLVSQNVQLAGFAVGGVALVFVTASQALAAASFTYATAAVILLLGTRRRPPAVAVDAAGVGSLAALRTLFNTPGMRPIIAMTWLPGFFAVAPEALANPYAAQIGGGTVAVGLLLTGLPVGSVIGELVVGSRVSPARRVRLVVPLAVVGFLPPLAFVLGPPLPLAVGLLVLAGMGAYMIGLDQLALATIPEAARRRAFALLGAGMMVTQGLGFAAAGAVAEGLPVTAVVPIFAAAGLVVVLVAGRRLAGARVAAPTS